MTETLIVIPVRAGSVGIPNKALRDLAGYSPLNRALITALGISADVVVATDVNLICAGPVVAPRVCRLSEDLARGDRSLDASVCFAVEYMERMEYPKTYQTVVTMQCTSPFTKRETLQRAIQISQEQDTTVLTVRDDRGLRWESAHLETPVLTSRAPRRVTRQQMPSCYRETGAVFVTPRKWVAPTSRFAHTAYLLEVTGPEAVDLDTMEDWWIAERYAQQATQIVLPTGVAA